MSHPCNSDLRLQPPNLLRPLSPDADPTPALATTSRLLLQTLLPLATTPTQLWEWCLTLVIARLVVATCTPILTSDPTGPDPAQSSTPVGPPSMLASGSASLWSSLPWTSSTGGSSSSCLDLWTLH